MYHKNVDSMEGN